MENVDDVAYVFIDQSNFHYFLSGEDWRIDWEKFNEYFVNKYGNTQVYLYEGILSKGSFLDRYPYKTVWEFNRYKFAKQQYFKTLKSLGFIVRTKPVGRVYDSTLGRFKHKCNFDVEITIDAMSNLDKYTTCILCSGDGDFVKLLKYVKGKFKKTVLLAPDDRINSDLEKTANQVLYLSDLKDEIKK